jgi:hypothetical protein
MAIAIQINWRHGVCFFALRSRWRSWFSRVESRQSNQPSGHGNDNRGYPQKSD